MMLPLDPTLMLLAVVAVFAYCAFSGRDKNRKRPAKPISAKNKWSEELKRRERYVADAKDKSHGKNSGGNDYLMWLYNHQQD